MALKVLLVDDETLARMRQPETNDAIRKAGLRFADGNQEHFARKPYVPDLRKAS